MGPSPHTFFEACLTGSICTPFSAKIGKKRFKKTIKKLSYCPPPGPIWALSTPKIVVQGLSQTCLLRSYCICMRDTPPCGMAVCHQCDARLQCLRHGTLNITY